jgi:hypothetical protein
LDPKSKKYSAGMEIKQALTEEQLAHLLDVIFDSVEEKTVEQILLTVDDDVSSPLSRILSPESEPPESSDRIVSDEKYIEEWEALWSDWEDIAFEIGDEEGKYVYQDRHWDPPSFSPYDVASDLEEVAKKMLPMIEKIFSLDRENDALFRQALQEIDDNVMGYPEWMGADCEDGIYDPVTTECLLQWEWLAAKSQKQDGSSFIRKIIDITGEFKNFALNDMAVINFFTSLPEPARKEIYDDMTKNRNEPIWQNRLSSIHSKWYKIYHSFSQTYDPELFLENCKDSIGEDWKLGLPLLEHLINKKDFAEADKIVKQTVASFLRYKTKQEWLPENSLLLTFHIYYTSFDAENKTEQLLKYWLSIAKGIGQEERQAALKLQLVTFKKTFELDDMINIFREIKPLPFFNMTERLFNQWQLFILNHCVENKFDDVAAGKKTWIFWLLDTGFDDSKDKTWFENNVNEWLQSLLKNPTQFKNQYGLVYTLTNDLAQNSSLKKQYPTLFEYILDHAYVGKEIMESRCTWLEKMNGQQFIPQLMECWKKNIGALVPDPANAHKARYERYALWMVVVKDLNPATFQKIIDQWEIAHRRRRNLWAALREVRLVV